MSESDFDVARLTVRLPAIVENFRHVERLAGPAAVGAVVKADGYGLGAEAVSRALANQAGCETFFVARLEEGVRLRPVVPKARIFVLDGAPPDAVPALLSNALTPVMNSLADIAAWNAAAISTRTNLDAALHVDTGMNRLGLPAHEMAVLGAEAARRLSNLRVVLIMSHLACADDPQAKLNGIQLDRFRAALEILPPAPASLASSGAILLGKAYHFDLVRPGLGLYGGNPQPGHPNPFAPTAVLTGRVLQVRRVDKGESVGYGATFRASQPSVVATVALGYADGLMRAIGNRGAGAIAGVRVPIVGRVSMDLLTLDVTAVEGVRSGDNVELVGDTITLEDVAMAAGTAPYEILTSLSGRARRTYLEVCG
jgi:alanine racemase